MRHGRAKAARKTLQFFRRSVGIEAPYQVILDGTFLVAMISQKVPLHERLDRTLQHETFVLHVTRSSLNELEKLATQTKQEVFAQARQWGLDNSDTIIEEADVPAVHVDEKGEVQDTNTRDLGAPGKDIVQLVQSPSQYFVCSQEETLLDILRFAGTTPVIRLARGVLLLENPSKVGQAKAWSQEKSKWSVAGSVRTQEKKLVDHVKDKQRQERKEVQADQQRQYQTGRAKTKAKGPNPLSCKKKRPGDSGSEQGKRKRRKKKKSDA